MQNPCLSNDIRETIEMSEKSTADSIAVSEEENETDATQRAPPEYNQNPEIDKLTLEMFMNNNYYTKYLSNSDPIKYQQYEEYRENIRIYKNLILELTEELMENPDKLIYNSSALHEKFNEYMRACVKFMQMREFENKLANSSSTKSIKYNDEYEDGLSDTE
jgi:hypothetical protein